MAKNIHSILVEGGRKTLISFLEAEILDAFVVFQSEKLLPKDGLQFPLYLLGDFVEEKKENAGEDTIFWMKRL